MLDDDKKEALDDLLVWTIKPAFFEDLGIDSDEDPEGYDQAIDYLAEELLTLKVG